MKFPPLGPRTVVSLLSPRGQAEPRGWDRVTIGGFVLPGKARVTSGGVAIKVDPKSKNGTNGSRPTYHGDEAQEVDVEVDVWEDEDLERLAEITRQLRRPGMKGKPVAFDAPQVRDLEIDHVVVERIGPLMDSGERGHKRRTFKCRHWLPSGAKKKSVSTTAKSSRRKNDRTEDARRRASQGAATEVNMSIAPSEDASVFDPSQLVSQ